MLSKATPSIPFRRPQATELARRLGEPRRLIQAIGGPRQVGKTTLVRQVVEQLGVRSHFASADEPALRGRAWIEQQWQAARSLLKQGDSSGAVLVLDEIQKIDDWSEAVKRLWDEDTAERRPLKLVVLGTAPLLVQRGLTESLAGRFELTRLPHWSLSEMRQAFGVDLAQFVFYGGYPGAAPLVTEPERWARYVHDSLIETTISRDVLLLTRVDKPALLRRLFELGCGYSGQVLSFTKMLGQLHEAGNTTTLAHYLELLAGAGMLTGLRKFSGRQVRQRGSSPKLQVLNTALLSAQSAMSFAEAQADRAHWGRLVESAAGAHLANAATIGVCELFYWREGNYEVDFVTRSGKTVTAIEVKSGRERGGLPGMEEFARRFRPHRTLLVGEGGIPLEEFLSRPVEDWVRG